MTQSLPAWAVELISVAAIVLGAIVILKLLERLLRRWASVSPEETADLLRARRRETAVGVLSSLVRYFVLLLTAFALLGLFVQNLLTAAAGATLLIAIVGFGAQRFLQDVIAGVFILLENQYGVGDFVTLEPSQLAGVVDEVGLRTTVLRNLNGDRYVVPNGQITGVRRTTRRFRRYTIDLLTHDPDEVDQTLERIVAIAPVGAARFLRAPFVDERQEVGDDLWLVRLKAEVPPTMEWLVETYLAGALRSSLGDSLVVEPLVYTLDDAAIRRYERTVLLRLVSS
ncbi:MAG TPA: mechanosensitive ion channel family protein [Gaiellaceae bacterium]|nr:mechanosensitive ion channel family protein [Gaiellaceae bacterium]